MTTAVNVRLYMYFSSDGYVRHHAATDLTLEGSKVALLLQVGLEVLATHSLITPLIGAGDLCKDTPLV